MSCLYKILGVAKTANKIEIKQAYRKLAVQLHPDKHTQSPPRTRAAAVEKFKQITNAYEILVDDRKRAAYDLRSNQSESRQHNRQERSNAGQSRQNNRGGDTKSSAEGAQSRGGYTKSSPDGGGEAKSPNAAQSRQRHHLKLRAAAALRHLRRVCVEFLRFTVQVIVETVVRAAVEMLIRLMLEILIQLIKAIFQPSSKHNDEKKKK
ncbi:uncharacterized protein LOC130987742 [Salvia miltiorrhiza]|uniref:uncharacterized protein LOC130987742 n=1 Tax=Salvia miltiorrhiza TaxID=226208 RepID=UPI0025AC061B|nr:uncharacterized protein LOC130987742 [Salvia miltiorrhiza]